MDILNDYSLHLTYGNVLVDEQWCHHLVMGNISLSVYTKQMMEALFFKQ